MQYRLSADGDKRLTDFVDRIGAVLGNKKRRESFAAYAMGLLGDGDRKSVEPIAARLCPDPKAVDALHQRLLHFASVSEWSDSEVRDEARDYALPLMTHRDPVEAWILDDTGFMKQGIHSVGVQRQYTGSVGKVANCQIGVSLCVATRDQQLPIDFELYLPKSWTEDPARRAEAGIPEEITFKTKIELAVDMLRRAVGNEVPRGVVLADSFYGDSAWFRREIRGLGLNYAVGVSCEAKAWSVDELGNRSGVGARLDQIAAETPRRSIRRVTWREGTKGPLSARFATRRVVPCHNDGVPDSEREEITLVIEWEDGKKEPSRYFFSSLPPSLSNKQLVRIIKQRWRTEQLYQELKGELGLDHFEGRKLRGWNHHVSVALCCYAFVAAERSGAFSPSGERAEDTSPESLAA